VAPLYRRADLLLMPSTYEPLGMSQIEALALHCPVLASNTGGIPETVIHGQTGTLVEAGNAQAWADAIASALDAMPQQRAWRRPVRWMSGNGLPRTAICSRSWP
jgi:glycosyltransferase involved in cell wall biosynthesis